MPIYYFIIAFIVVFLIVSLILNILTSPITWIIIAALVIYSAFKRYTYAKKVEEMNKKYQEEVEQQRQAYQSRQQYHQGSEDIIDVNYQEFEDDN